jgi:maltose alpha-D-glucosyltransferase/alpha-amylase
VRLRVPDPRGERLVDLLGTEHSQVTNRGHHEIALDGYGFRWFRVGTADETLTRAPY